jgi:predicted membrane protein
MTSRARDVVPATGGLYLIALGIVLLLDSTGAHAIGIEGAIGSAFGLAFVALGVLAFFAAWRVRRFSRQMRRAVGHVRSSAGGWSMADDAVISTVVGDIALDLRDVELPEGETELALLCWLGTIQVRVPGDIGLDVTAQSMVGSIDVLGRREEGVVRDIHVRSEGYEQRPRRVKMRLSTFVGELMVVQI